MLGVNSPVVPAWIVRLIFACEFGDGSSPVYLVTWPNCRTRTSSLKKGDQAKTIISQLLEGSCVNFLTSWPVLCLHPVLWGCFPNKGTELASYHAMILHGPDLCKWWRTYDPQFREQFTDLEMADFTRVDQTVYSRFLWMASATGSQRVAASTSVEHALPPLGKRKRTQVCYACNDGKMCPVFPCRYAHVCAKCGEDHRMCAIS